MLLKYQKRGIKTINKFFNYENVKKLKSLKNKINIITAANAICHIPNLKSLIKGIDFLLDDNGLFIFEELFGSAIKKVHTIKYMMNIFLCFRLVL